MKTLVIIPALNESGSIKGVIEDLREHSPSCDPVVIDDGSTDSTAAVAAGLGVRVISLPFNLGIGSAVQTGYKYASMNGYDFAVQFDGDGQHRADQLEKLLAPLEAGQADMVVGSRFLESGLYEAEKSRMAGIRILSVIISALMRRKITDPTSGFRAVNKKVLDFFASQYPDDYPEPESVLIVHKTGCRVVEVPVLMRRRLLGTSSITFLRAFYYMIKVILAILIDMIKKVPVL